MKKFLRFTTLSIALCALFAISCSDEDQAISDKESPAIELAIDELSGLPGEAVQIKADISDDAGIDYIKIESMNWEFNDKIVFSDQNMITNYDLRMNFTIPEWADRGNSQDIAIIVYDHAGSQTTEYQKISVINEPARLTIDQELGYNIVINGGVASVANNDVSFTVMDNLKLPVKLQLSSNKTKLLKLTVVCESLNISEDVDLTAIATDQGQTAEYNAEFPIVPAAGEDTHKFIFTLHDEKGATATYNPTVLIKSTFSEHNQKHLKMFTQDLSVDMAKVAFGLPMLAEKKSVESYKFTAQYYSPKENTEVVFVSSKDTKTQIKYGVSNDKKYIIKSDSPNPIVLEGVGHYEITFDLLIGSYEVKALSQQSSKFAEMYFVYKWADYPAMSQADAANAPAIWSLDYKLAEKNIDVEFGIGGGQWLVAIGEDNYNPELWLTKEDKDKYPGEWYFDIALGAVYGDCQIVFDTFLMKGYAVQK